MGKVANQALERRQRQRVRQLGRSSSTSQVSAPARGRLRTEVRAALVELRRALRLKRSAHRAAARADVRAALAVERLTEEGLTHHEVAEASGISPWTVRRLSRLARDLPAASEPNTAGSDAGRR